MDQLIEPNIHPIFVHFAFALVFTAAASYALASLAPVPKWRDSLRPAADWMLAFGALAIVLTVAAGFQAYYSVAHDAPSHAAMTTHRNWAVPTALFVFALAAWRWFNRAKPASTLFTVLLVAGALAMTTTAWWGGRLVYGYGLGVASLPQAEADGHDHDGAAAHAHGAGQAASAVPVQAGTPEAAVEAFGAALRASDAAALRALLTADVVIAESGGVERSFDEYAGHHMPADMAFAQAVSFTLEQRDVVGASSEQATVISRSRAEGGFRGQDVHSRMMETMVLVRENGAWRIKHIHWSSAPIADEHAH